MKSAYKQSPLIAFTFFLVFTFAPISIACAAKDAVRLSCNFLAPELRGGRFKLQAIFHIDMDKKKVRAFWETDSGDSVVDFKITQINDEMIYAVSEVPAQEHEGIRRPIIINRYTLNVALPVSGEKYSSTECVQVKKGF